ncbi:hypothetical protein [Streptomyces sp. NPDC058401]|uniref:hypothetical protein n=1 Tax=Streptomyces sp. NPDC058401 TaxID=3346480 RepID=UPI00365E3439
MLTPLRPTDGATVYALWNALATQLTDHWGFLSDVAVPFDGYRGRDVFPYGVTVVVETRIGRVCVDTAGLPVDPGARA